MKDLFVPYEIAVKLKEKGMGSAYPYEYYTKGKPEIGIKGGVNFYDRIPAPLWQQVIDWFLSKGIVIRISGNAVGFEIRAVEWDKDEYLWMQDIESAIEKALELI